MSLAAALSRVFRPRRRPSPPLSSTYPGDYTDEVSFRYRPDMDGDPDPGEVVWTWIPFEENPAEGKDRPVLVIGKDGKWLLGLTMSSKDHDRDAADEARYGRYWLDIGSGDWDVWHRPSEVRLDRVVRVNPKAMRREGAILDRPRFDAVERAVKEMKGW